MLIKHFFNIDNGALAMRPLPRDPERVKVKRKLPGNSQRVFEGVHAIDNKMIPGKDHVGR